MMGVDVTDADNYQPPAFSPQMVSIGGKDSPRAVRSNENASVGNMEVVSLGTSLTFDGGPSVQVFLGCLQRVSSNPNGKGGRRKNSLLHRAGNVLLYEDAVRSKERRGHLSKTGRLDLPKPDRKKPGGIPLRELASLNVLGHILSEWPSPFFSHTKNYTKEKSMNTMDHGRGRMDFQADEETDHVASIADTTFPGRDVIRIPSGPLQANYVIREIHMGSCGMHVYPRAVVRKAMRQGYYWPTMHADAKTELGIGHNWSVNYRKRGAKFVVVAIDYFTKWVEAKPLVKITGKEIIRFVMDNIRCKYGLPRIIVTDNGAQLVNDPFKSWCKRFEIQQMELQRLAHRRANGFVERANRSLMEEIKTRLGREKAGWVDELPNVLWVHRTSI
ncbi:reverse transcriptase domain-containing protein [Tanacetum coccineum]|uniref:Reverse transcriptase domain-containing protein n=1 Tax=Tanacetum coccineum TaxID=301880 RepID=A0ABQ5BDQ2_9ASTR